MLPHATKGTVKVTKLRILKNGRLFSIIWVNPVCNHKCFIREEGKKYLTTETEGNETTETKMIYLGYEDRGKATNQEGTTTTLDTGKGKVMDYPLRPPA